MFHHAGDPRRPDKWTVTKVWAEIQFDEKVAKMYEDTKRAKERLSHPSRSAHAHA